MHKDFSFIVATHDRKWNFDYKLKLTEAERLRISTAALPIQEARTLLITLYKSSFGHVKDTDGLVAALKYHSGQSTVKLERIPKKYETVEIRVE